MPQSYARSSVLPQKVAREVGDLPIVMPAKACPEPSRRAGIQKHLIFLDSGSRQPKADSAGMTFEICDEFLKHHTKLVSGFKFRNSMEKPPGSIFNSKPETQNSKLLIAAQPGFRRAENGP